MPAPVVTGINRLDPMDADTNATSVLYAVTFSESVTGVDPTDFRVLTGPGLSAASPVVVLGSGDTYAVKVNGIQGTSTLQLILVDNDSIVDGSSAPLGGVGTGDRDLDGDVYNIDQTNPVVTAIARSAPSSPDTNLTSVTFEATFSEDVTGVCDCDFQLALNGVTGMIDSVTPVGGSLSVYEITVVGVHGNGTLGLNLVDDDSIRDLVGNPLAAPGYGLALQDQATYAAGTAPFSVAVADLNGDGRPDLVTTSFGVPPYGDGSSVSVLLNNGDGTFQDAATYLTGPYPVSVVVADVNGDGLPDLVTANLGQSCGCYSGVSVLLNNGDGTFAPAIDTEVDGSVLSVAVGDVNGDGSPDLAVVTGQYDNVSVLLGIGDGTFQAQQDFPSGPYPQSVAVADVNGDGRPDLVVANYGSRPYFHDRSVSVLLGNGDGLFQSPLTFGVGENPNAVVVADVNGDGIPDILVADASYDGVSVLLGNGDGTFQDYQTADGGPYAYAVAVADINGDGRPDLLTANIAYDDASVLLGYGDGTFAYQQLFDVGYNPNSVAAGDFNGDGRPDLVVANRNSDNVSVLLNAARGDFTGETYNIDQTPPTSHVNALPQRSSSLSFTVSVTGSDPAVGSGTPSGTGFYDIYVYNGSWSLWTTVSASSPSALYTATSSNSYGFYSIAHDAAGNIETKVPRIEASTYVPDLTPPLIHVGSVNVNATTATFTVNWSGTATGGSGLSAVDLFVSVDLGTPTAIAHVVPGSPSGGVYSGSVTYQAISDDNSHNYRFYSLGTNGNSIQQAPPSGSGDYIVSASFAAPTTLQATGFSVAHGLVQRSFIRYVDVKFNVTPNSIQLNTSTVRLVKFALDGTGIGTPVDLTGKIFFLDHVMELDFDTPGLGGSPNTNAADGYYKLQMDLDHNGSFETERDFYRLFGDVNGDKRVDNADINLITLALGKTGPALNADVNGDGFVNALDRTYASRNLGRQLGVGLNVDA